MSVGGPHQHIDVIDVVIAVHQIRAEVVLIHRRTGLTRQVVEVSTVDGTTGDVACEIAATTRRAHKRIEIIDQNARILTAQLEFNVGTTKKIQVPPRKQAAELGPLRRTDRARSTNRWVHSRNLHQIRAHFGRIA